jgi:CheY-like chemotaxis protein
MTLEHILVVEDDFYGREMIKRLMTHHGVQAEYAESAEEALNLLAANTYSLAILDLSLPNMDGWELLQAIQENVEYLPCVAITAYHDVTVAEHAREAGFIAFFPKPLMTSFVQELEELLDG